MRIYLASPLGFSEAGLRFLVRDLLPILTELHLDVKDPWESIRNRPWPEVVKSVGRLTRRDNELLAKHNADSIRAADCVVAVLDGTDVDSGTAAEIGYAYANQKTIFGYLGDLRVSKDNAVADINLQIEWFIRESGGGIVKSLDELKKTLEKFIDEDRALPKRLSSDNLHAPALRS